MNKSSATVYVINGPNLNQLGQREPDVYGSETLADIEARCQAVADRHQLRLEFRQSNHEGALVDWIQEASDAAIGVVLNAAGYTHESIAILDAVRACRCPVIEVHLSNIHAREEYRRTTRLGEATMGSICGLGSAGYEYAIESLVAAQQRSER